MFKLANMLFLSDAVAALFSHQIGQYVRFGGLQVVPVVDGTYILRGGLYVLVVLISGYFCELYTGDRYLSRSELAARTSVSIMLAFFVLSAIFYTAPETASGRGVLALSLLIFGVMQYLTHRVFQSFQNFPHLAQKVIILGVGPLAEVIERAIPLSPHNYVFAGFVQPEMGMPTVSPNSIIGQINNIEEIISREKIDKLVVSLTEKRGALPVRNLLTCKMRGIEILDSPTFYESLTGKLLIEDIHPSWFIYSNGFRVSNFRRVWKRALDIFLSAVGLILVAPLIPLFALLVKISSPGPVFFKQKRVGEKGCEFTLLKFRTMCDNAEADTGPVWSCENDPRITKLGCWLRKARIDEIPQLINVLKGEMSFIGPRPERKEFVDQLSEKIPYYGKRHFIKPGVTGWAQVRYPYGASDEDALEKLRYDLYYLKNYTFTLDLMIVLETIKVVLFGRGGR